MSQPSISHRFPKVLRLTRPGDFKRVFKHGRRLRLGAIVLVVAPNGSQTPRLGLAIAKRNVKLSNRRNTVKRVARESFRHAQHSIRGFDVIVLSRPGLNGVSSEELRRLFDSGWPSGASRDEPRFADLRQTP